LSGQDASVEQDPPVGIAFGLATAGQIHPSVVRAGATEVTSGRLLPVSDQEGALPKTLQSERSFAHFKKFLGGAQIVMGGTRFTRANPAV